MSSHDYDVGYGKPPRAHQFQKGKSGNRRGRRKKPSAGLARTIERLLMEPVPITERGTPRNAPALELIILQLLNKVSDGKPKALRVLHRYQTYARARPAPRLTIDPKVGAERYQRLLERDDGCEGDGLDNIGRKTRPAPKPGPKPKTQTKTLSLEDRFHRMMAGLEEIEITRDMTAHQASELYQRLLQEPPRRMPISKRPGKGLLSAAEIFDLALYSKLALKSGNKAAPSRIVAVIRRVLMKAVGGDLPSAILLMDLHAFAEKHGDL